MDGLTTLTIPRALKDVGPLVLDMTSIYGAAARVHEVSIVNNGKAPELLALFNVAYLNVARCIAVVEYEREVAEKRLGEIRAVLLLDKMPELLRKKGLTTDRNPLGSVDMREAVINQDPEYQDMAMLAINLKCHLTLLKEFKSGFEMAYNGVKKVMGDSIGSQNRANPYLVAPAPASNPDNRSEAETDFNDFFGTPR